LPFSTKILQNPQIVLSSGQGEVMSTSIPASTLDRFTNFGDLLRFLRRRAGLTQMELASAVGYSDAQISRLEQNLRLPDIPTIEARFLPALGLEADPKAAGRLVDLAGNVRREDAPGLGLCPYKGLNYFDEAEADLFVGREALTARLTERLLALVNSRSGEQPRFLAVVGASGSGKSSLVRAGLAAGLRWNKAAADWNIQVFTPTAHPLESLALSLTQEEHSLSAVTSLMDDLASDRRSLDLCIKRLLKTDHGAHCLLIVDQFEELFTLCRSDVERTAFIDSLLTAAWETNGPTAVVITLRADFYAHCSTHPGLRQALATQQEYIGAMSADELRRAIEEPARRGRWEMETGLAALLLHDVGHEPGALPLLSHALLETWQRRRGRTMTLSGYTASGGVRGAIAETAEAVFADQFNIEQKAIARRIFLRLTELGDDTASGDTRRRARLQELILDPDEAETTQNVLKALADARLVITSQDSVEVAHEALIREWPTLRGWLEENRDGLRLHRHLTEAAQDWAARQREADVLYRGARLAQACEWASSHLEELNPLEREFLAAAQDLADCEASERENQRKRELAAAQQLAQAEQQRAEDQAQAAQQLRQRALYLAMAFIVAISLALAAGFLGWRARAASRLASSRELAAAAISNLEIDPERSVLLALQAIETTYTLEAEDALHQAVVASRIRQTIPAHQAGTPVSLAYSPDGSRLVTASPDEVVKVWETATSHLLFSIAGHFAAYSPDGQRLATVTADGAVKLWQAKTGQEIALAGPIQAGVGVAFSSDGARLATVTGGNLPRVWDIETGNEIASFRGHSDYVSFAFFSPNGQRLLTVSDDGTARVWDAATGEELLRFTDHPGWVWTAAYSPDGSQIATASENKVMIWDAVSGAKLHTLIGHLSSVYAVAFSPDGTRLATSSQDRKITLWDAVTGQALFNLAGHRGAIYSLAFSPDGYRLASGSDDGSVRIWGVTPGGEWLTVPAPNDGVSLVTFSPDGARLAGSESNSVKLWDAQTGKELAALSKYDQSVSALAFSPDGKYFATAGDEAHIILWDAETGQELYNWSGHTGRINALAFSPVDQRLVSASSDYKVKIWDIAASARQTAASLSFSFELSSGISAIAFSPDGSTLSAGLENGISLLWNLATKAELFAFRGQRDSIVSMAFSPDGKQLATASLDGSARVWSTETGQDLLTLAGHTNAVLGIAYSPDGQRIATASRDGTIKIWVVKTDQEILTLAGNGEAFNSLAFSPNGSRLAAGNARGMQVYLLKIQDLVTLAQTRVSRQLTVEECQKYLHRLTPACVEPAPLPTATALPPATAGRICQVTNTGGLNDNYFNALIFKGLQNAAGELGWEDFTLQSAAISDYEKNLTALSQSNCNLIAAPGNLAEAVKSAAGANPGQKYLLVDSMLDLTMENLWSQLYATDQAAFLAGYLAAAVTRTGKVGVFGGIDIPQVTDFMDGFTLGVRYYNEKNTASVEVIGWEVDKHVGLFTGGFCCTTEGRLMAEQLLNEGVDIILPVAGQSVGSGAGAEVLAHGQAWLIGVDNDWASTSPELAEVVLTSIEKRFDVSVIAAARALASGTFTGGVHLGTLESGEVGLSPFHALEYLVTDQVKTDLEQIKAEIIAGKIKTRP
jgi:WD40 repeat protein/basic membrane lipoprotein Med (substrate-binding protein (PBP1-ABC) superfamily)/transcriptional regulator with XRE-family HTH domain